MKDKKSAVIKGTIYWPFFERQNPMKAGKYTVDLGQLSAEAVQTLKEMGLGHKVKVDEPKEGYERKDGKFVPDDPEARSKPDKGVYIQCQSGYPPKVFDLAKRDVDPNIVGNGTVANVRVSTYEWTFKAEKGLGAGFNAVQIVNLVEFRGGDNFSDFEFQEPSEDDFPTGGDEGEFEK